MSYIESLLKGILIGSLAVFVASSAKAESFDITEHSQEHCMALNVYYEARGSNLADKYAVADVVLNRKYDIRWPNTVCGVVQDGYKKGRRDCQFSWYCDGKSDNPLDIDSWKQAQMVAWSIMRWNEMRGISEGANHYHAAYVSPRWAKDMALVGRIGAHIFYRWE